MKVLLVAGEGRAADTTREQLQAIDDWNVRVRRSTTLADALELARQEPFDVALLDVDAAGEESAGPVARLREAVPELPVVVLVSAEDRRAGVRAVRQGAEDLLVEGSLSPGALRRSIRHAIERRVGALMLERSNRAFEAFAHTVAHEIRSPLSTISFACELLGRQQMDEAGVRQVERIRNAVSEVDRIIHGLLEYASATHDEESEEVDLAVLVAEVIESLRDAGVDPGTITVEALPRVRSGRSPLRLVVQNLLENAVRYAREDEPRVRVDAVRRERAWEVRVEDNGEGIAPEDRARVFEMFHRGPESRGDGAGLGLAICRRIVEGRGGRIEADTGPMGGCRVCFTLPDDPVQLDLGPLA